MTLLEFKLPSAMHVVASSAERIRKDYLEHWQFVCREIQNNPVFRVDKETSVHLCSGLFEEHEKNLTDFVAPFHSFSAINHLFDPDYPDDPKHMFPGISFFTTQENLLVVIDIGNLLGLTYLSYWYIDIKSIQPGSSTDKVRLSAIQDYKTITRYGEYSSIPEKHAVDQIIATVKFYVRFCRLISHRDVKDFTVSETISRTESRRMERDNSLMMHSYRDVMLRPGKNIEKIMNSIRRNEYFPKREHDVRSHMRHYRSGKIAIVKPHKRGLGGYRPSNYTVVNEGISTLP